VAIKIKLLQGDTLTVRVDAETWNRAFKVALESGSMIQVHNEEGHVLAVNPHQVAYLEEVPDEAAQPEKPEAPRQPEPAAR
jgi:hypothetical protein